MSEKIVVGPINRGFRKDRTAFVIDNDSFPTLINAYQWRGRVKRKRGTSPLNRLTRVLPTASIGVSSASPWTINTIYSNYTPAITPETNASVKPGSVSITISSIPNIIFTDQSNGILSAVKLGNITGATQANPCEITSVGHTLSTGDVVTINNVTGMTQLNGNVYTITVTGANTFTLNGVDSTGFSPYTGGGTWRSSSSSNTGTINYLTGVIVLTHTAGAGVATTASFSYFPNLPVMGIEDLQLDTSDFPGTLAFDTKYAYNILTSFPYSIYDVSYYKNAPSATINGISYTQKTTATPITWNGQDYQQFWTVNYQGSLWATNGIEIRFDPTNVGMQFQKPNTLGITRDSSTQMTFLIDNCPLVVGDWVFVNEFLSATPANANTLNYQTGFVTSVTTVGATSTVIVSFPYANIAADTYTNGILQYLTNRLDITKDCIRWYDGDPTNGVITNPVPIPGKGWVNFCPPLNDLVSNPNFSIADLPPAQYYLVGARMIIPFKDRLLFLGPVIQTSTAGSQVYLQDTIIYSQNGTPYYTASFNGDKYLATTVFHQLLVPINQTASPVSFLEDSTGFGGFLTAGLAQPITGVSSNEDVLILGFSKLQARLIYSGNDIIPFNLFIINSELGTSSTFSVINLDRGVLSRGSRGYIITSQTEAQRIDLDIPDQVFQTGLLDNGTERICSQRNFIDEWIYFTYRSNQTNESIHKFPNQSLLYNYRDSSWAIINECYTTYGLFTRQTGFTWQTVGLIYPTWSSWNDPWNAGTSTLLQQEVLGGNQQGYIVFKDDGTDEAYSLYIQSFSANQITSPDHGLNENDYIVINNCLGTVAPYVNTKIFRVYDVTQNTFKIDTFIGSVTYIGAGEIKRLYVPFIQTKQFPMAWGLARKTRIGPQQYLFNTTQNCQITLLIYLSQNASSAYNFPAANNGSVIYSSVLYTCPESTNLGLTPANINLNLVTSDQQEQTWHRMNTSLLGDTVQIGFTLSDEQMKSLTPASISLPITSATQTNPCVLTCSNSFPVGQQILIQDVVGMTQLNGNIYNILSVTSTTITIDVDASVFSPYISGGTATGVYPQNQIAEIELHAMILDVSPSQLLA